MDKEVGLVDFRVKVPYNVPRESWNVSAGSRGLALSDLPPHHKDPFDRLLIAQALAEDALLVSADAMFSRYSVKLFW
jgi:hypothetical protein